MSLLPILALLGLAAAASAGEIRAPQCAGESVGWESPVVLRQYWARRGNLGAASPTQSRAQQGVAVLQDQGDLVATRNLFDLERRNLRFVPNATGSYQGLPGTGVLGPTGTPIDLSAGGPQELELPFSFPFFGTRHRQVFIYGNGHLTLGEAESPGGGWSLARFLAGPPRVAPLFTDLDPSRGGSVSARMSAEAAVFLWRDVPGGGQINRNSFQVMLLPNGEIELTWGEVGSGNAVVGLSPGRGLEFTAADFSSGQPSGARGALVERFSEREELDLVSTLHRFYRDQSDAYDQVVVYTGRPLNPSPGSLAFEINVRNEVAGIGLPVFDATAEWGSPGRLSSIVFMDSVDPYLEVDGFEVLAHEAGHRWLANARTPANSGSPHGVLQGSGGHWSFFLDTDASVMGGNDIVERSPGRFETVDIARRYSPLDQYLMGLRLPEEVPPFFYVEGADDFRPNRGYKPSSGSEPGVTFTGVRREVRIQEVVAAMGARLPDASRSPRVFRQAYILIADAKAPATPARLAAVARIRAGFEAYFREATDGRGAVVTTLP
ncbi:MAG TPA: hypothetical protein VJU18_18275 [Vicinamibacteria bacterium]|nr:hypothetical protein [Vicinamibacteria bacterium]